MSLLGGSYADAIHAEMRSTTTMVFKIIASDHVYTQHQQPTVDRAADHE